MIVSFYTFGNGYRKEASRLVDSLREHGLAYRVIGVEDRGSWLKNTQYKTTFVREMLDRLRMPLAWVDADARVLRYPGLFHDLNCDVAAHIHSWGRRRELLSGTMYFGDTRGARAFLDEAIRGHERKPQVRQQVMLQRILERWKGRVRFRNLPASYTRIFDLMKEVKDPVIEHYQASRRLKERRAAR